MPVALVLDRTKWKQKARKGQVEQKVRADDAEKDAKGKRKEFGEFLVVFELFSFFLRQGVIFSCVATGVSNACVGHGW
jgi:hypothetical protein